MDQVLEEEGFLVEEQEVPLEAQQGVLSLVTVEGLVETIQDIREPDKNPSLR